MTQFFANAAASHFAQAACAAVSQGFPLWLASFIILPLAVLVRNKTEQPVRITTQLRLLSRFSARDRD